MFESLRPLQKELLDVYNLNGKTNVSRFHGRFVLAIGFVYSGTEVHEVRLVLPNHQLRFGG